VDEELSVEVLASALEADADAHDGGDTILSASGTTTCFSR
jgi:hypothetical protein